LALREFEALSAEIHAAMAEERSIARVADLALEDARRVFGALHTRRLARGEKPVGRKIGFTNRTIWAEYGVYAPNWGYMTKRSVADLARTAAFSRRDVADGAEGRGARWD
jgi:2-keto-4-pentenoate hydratase